MADSIGEFVGNGAQCPASTCGGVLCSSAGNVSSISGGVEVLVPQAQPVPGAPVGNNSLGK
jgi:hypothetical protein